MNKSIIKGKRRLRYKIDFKYNLSLYLTFLKKYKLLFISLLTFVFLIALTRLVDRFLFKIIVDKGTEFTANTITSDMLVNTLLIVLTIFISMEIIKAIFKFIHLHLMNLLVSRLIVDLKRKFFNHLMTLSYNFHTTHRTGSLISKLIRIGGAVERLTDVIIFNFAPLLIEFLVAAAALLYFNTISAIVVLLTITSFIGYSFIIQKLQESSNIIANESEDKEKANVGDMFLNIDSIKYFGKENRIILRFKKLSEITKKAFLKHWDYFRYLDAGQSIIISIGTLLLLYFPIIDFINKKISIGSIVFIYTIYGGLMGPLFGFVHGIRGFYRSMADFEVLFRFAKIENEIKDRPNAKQLKVKNGEIELNKIYFRYGQRRLFTNFNLKIKKNKKIALVGHSGCGKTTLIKLLYRLYDVDTGRIMIDGEDIRNFTKKSLRNEMSIVPQECALFDDTIFNNIKFSNPEATEKQVKKAIKFAQLDKIIKFFPKKEKTIVGERGVRLSGGEKQRVSIARAILADKKILILDEATSSLDSHTEHEIQKDLARLMKGRTSIIIAHRLSTIMKADEIIVMEKGKIVQQGKHKDLIKKKGIYKKLWKLQKGGYIK